MSLDFNSIFNMVEKCSQLLFENKKNIAFAESVTGGYISYLFSMTVHAGDVLKGCVVCYDAGIKKRLLNVPDEMISKYTPESLEVTAAITRGLKQVVEADIYLGITGLSKSGGSETREKPVGTMFTCIMAGEREITDRALFKGDERNILDCALENVVELITYQINSNDVCGDEDPKQSLNS